MISSISLVLCMGKLGSVIFNYLEAHRGPSSDPKNTFERRNVCAKTMRANLVEVFTYGLISFVAFLLKK